MAVGSSSPFLRRWTHKWLICQVCDTRPASCMVIFLAVGNHCVLTDTKLYHLVGGKDTYIRCYSCDNSVMSLTQKNRYITKPHLTPSTERNISATEVMQTWAQNLRHQWHLQWDRKRECQHLLNLRWLKQHSSIS